MEVIIDHFEGEFAVVEVDINNKALISKKLLTDAKEGDIIKISIDHNATENRQKYIESLINEVFKD